MSELTYNTYLRMEDLLSLQEPRLPETADRAVRLSEQFFIIAHQASELWLKQVIADLDAATDALLPDRGMSDVELALESVDRATQLLRLIHDQLITLEKMPLRHFAEFRPYLGTASGAQSTQFQRLDSLLGDDQAAEGLYQAFAALVRRHGMSMSDVCRRGVRRGFSTAFHRSCSSWGTGIGAGR